MCVHASATAKSFLQTIIGIYLYIQLIIVCIMGFIIKGNVRYSYCVIVMYKYS